MPVTRRRPSRAGAALVGLLLAGVAEAVLARASSGPGGILERQYVLLGVIGAWAVVFALAVRLAFLVPRRPAVVVVLLLATLVRLASVSAKAPLSDDLYRYAWDGVVQHADINPYLYPPEADRLRSLRDTGGGDWLWPQSKAGKDRETRINRPNVETIYPPVAEAWFWAVHAVVPLSLQDRGFELVGLVLELAIMAVLLALLRSRGRDPRWIALYALCPVPVLEHVQNAHVDALGVLLTLLAVLAVQRSPRAPAWAGAALAAAALVKVYPVLLLPLLLRRRQGRARVLLAFAGVAVVGYLPHVADVGIKVLGYLPGYLSEEKYDEGTRYVLVTLTGLSGLPATALTAALLLALLVWVLRGMRAPDGGPADYDDHGSADGGDLAVASVRLLAGVFLLITPVQPWYTVLLVALATVTGAWWAVAVSLAAYPLFFQTITEGGGVAYGRVSYGLAAVLVLGVSLARRRAQESVAVRTG